MLKWVVKLICSIKKKCLVISELEKDKILKIAKNSRYHQIVKKFEESRQCQFRPNKGKLRILLQSIYQISRSYKKLFDKL